MPNFNVSVKTVSLNILLSCKLSYLLQPVWKVCCFWIPCVILWYQHVFQRFWKTTNCYILKDYFDLKGLEKDMREKSRTNARRYKENNWTVCNWPRCKRRLATKKLKIYLLCNKYTANCLPEVCILSRKLPYL